MDNKLSKLIYENWGETSHATPTPVLAYLAAIVESSNDAIIGKTLDGTILSWNKSAERLFGYTAKEAIGKNLSIIVPKDLLDEEKIIINNLRQGKYIDHYETVRRTKSGALIDVSLSISPIINARGKIVGAAKVAREITERKRLKGNLKFLAEASKILSSSLDYQTTLENVTKLAVPQIADWCAIDLFNQKGQLDLVALSHKDPKKIVWGRKLREKYPINLTLSTGLSQVLKTGKSEIYPTITDDMLIASSRNNEELKIAREIGFLSAMVVPLNSAGKVIGGITFVISESSKSYTEGDLIMAEELANRASLAIENAKLYRETKIELKERKRIEKQKNDFITMASHELRTPLTSLTIFSQVLQKKLSKKQTKEAEKFIDKIIKQLSKLSELVNELLDITRIQRGKIELHKEQFYVKELAEEVVESLQPVTKHKLNLDWHTKLPVYADKERIRHVLINLVTNAIKYSPTAKKIIVSSNKKSNYIEVSIQDFGLGIPKSEQKKIFEKFYQSKKHRTFPGFGLGLYISSEIIKMHSGKMRVNSTKGEGSTFYFTLPIYKEN